MLLSLTIIDFFFIRKASLSFSSSTNVFTGESGSGKSLFLHALSCLLGMRLRSHIVLSEKTELSGVFCLKNNSQVKSDLIAQGYLISTDDLFTVKRQWVHGKSRVFINKKEIRLREWRKIVLELFQFHSQLELQKIFDEDQHLVFLDNFLNDSHILKNYQTAYAHYQNKKNEVQKVKTFQQSFEKEKGLLEKRRQDYLHIFKDYESYLEARHSSEIHLKKRVDKDNLDTFFQYMEQTEFSEGLKKYEFLIDSLNEEFIDLQTKEEALKAIITLNDTFFSLYRYHDHITEALLKDEEKEERLYKTEQMAREYQLTISELYREKDIFFHNFEHDNDLENRLLLLQTEEAELRKETEKYAQHLSLHRKEQALLFEKNIISYLKELGFYDVFFEVRFFSCELGERGQEKIVFYASFNRGQDLEPLHKVASGGEGARFLFGLKLILSEKMTSKGMVFDEIDANVDADAVALFGKKISQIAKKTQMFIVTHSAVLSSVAEAHFKVQKKRNKDHTEVMISLLNENEKKCEYRRMIGNALLDW